MSKVRVEFRDPQGIPIWEQEWTISEFEEFVIHFDNVTIAKRRPEMRIPIVVSRV